MTIYEIFEAKGILTGAFNMMKQTLEMRWFEIVADMRDYCLALKNVE